MKLESSMKVALVATACLREMVALKLTSSTCPNNKFPSPTATVSSLGLSYLEALGDSSALQSSLGSEASWIIGAWWGFSVVASSSCHYATTFGFSGGGNGFLTFTVPAGALNEAISVADQVKDSGSAAKFASRYKGTMTDCSVNFTNFCLAASTCDTFTCFPSDTYSKKSGSSTVGNSTSQCCDVRYCKDEDDCSAHAGEYVKRAGWDTLKGSTKGSCCTPVLCSDSDVCSDTKLRNRTGTGIRGSTAEQCCEPAHCLDHKCTNPQEWAKLPNSDDKLGSTNEECCEHRTCDLVNCTPSSFWLPRENPASLFGYTLAQCCEAVSCENYTCSEPSKYKKIDSPGTVTQGSTDEQCCTPRLCSEYTCENSSMQLVALSAANPKLGSTDDECCELKFCKDYKCSDPTKWVHKPDQDPSIIDQRGYSDEECCSPLMCSTHQCDPPSKWATKNSSALEDLQGSTNEQCCDKIFCNDYACSTATSAEGEGSRGTAYYKRVDTNNFMWQGSTDDECCLPLFCSQYTTQYPSKWRRKTQTGLKGSTDEECYDPIMCAYVPGGSHDSYCCLGDNMKLRADALNVSGSTDDECCVPK